MTTDLDDCSSCGEECPTGECPASKRPCGHHCNHSWSHEECCWCGKKWGLEDYISYDDMIAIHNPQDLKVRETIIESLKSLWFRILHPNAKKQ